MKKTILVIEDNFEVRDNIVELLELDGYNLLQAENGKVGVKLAIEHVPDLILCDVMMPELDGFGVLKILSRNTKLMHIPFMFLSAKGDKADIRFGMGLGADDYITKPFNGVDLIKAIEIRLAKYESFLNNQQKSQEKETTFINKEKALNDFQEFSSIGIEQTYQKKDKIINFGHYPRYLYIVKEGLLKSSQYSEYGKELIVDFYKKGDFFGYSDQLIGHKYSYSVTAISDGTLLCIPVDDFIQFLYKKKDYMAIFLEKELRRKQLAQNKLVDFAYSSMREKVAKGLSSLSEDILHSDTISISRSDLAAFCGLAKETVIRTISELKADYIIEVNGQEITIKDSLKLQSIFK